MPRGVKGAFFSAESEAIKHLEPEDEVKFPFSCDDVLAKVAPELATKMLQQKAELREQIEQLKEARAEVIPLDTGSCVYRLWGEDDTCLYIGQSTRFHPIVRVGEHRIYKDWWEEVKRADFILCPTNFLDEFENYQILLLNPKYNTQRRALKNPKFWFGVEGCA